VEGIDPKIPLPLLAAADVGRRGLCCLRTACAVFFSVGSEVPFWLCQVEYMTMTRLAMGRMLSSWLAIGAGFDIQQGHDIGRNDHYFVCTPYLLQFSSAEPAVLCTVFPPEADATVAQIMRFCPVSVTWNYLTWSPLIMLQKFWAKSNERLCFVAVKAKE